jgi:hypothetical protein
MAIDDLDQDGNDQSAFFATLDDSTSTNKTHLVIQAQDGSQNTFGTFLITGVTDQTGWFEIDLSMISASGGSTLGFDAGEDFTFQFSRVGDKGTTGSTGPTGPTGPSGPTGPAGSDGAATETITDVTIGSGTSGTTSGIYFGANDEAGVVAGEVSSASLGTNAYMELMNCDLDAESGASGLQTIELTVQIQDETNNNVESFKALVQGIEKTVLGTTVREVNYTEWAVIYTSGANRIGQLEADYDSSDDTIRIRYKHTQSSTATLTATFYAVTMQNNT